VRKSVVTPMTCREASAGDLSPMLIALRRKVASSSIPNCLLQVFCMWIQKPREKETGKKDGKGDDHETEQKEDSLLIAAVCLSFLIQNVVSIFCDT